jgi:hypothetical protein
MDTGSWVTTTTKKSSFARSCGKDPKLHDREACRRRHPETRNSAHRRKFVPRPSPANKAGLASAWIYRRHGQQGFRICTSARDINLGRRRNVGIRFKGFFETRYTLPIQIRTRVKCHQHLTRFDISPRAEVSDFTADPAPLYRTSSPDHTTARIMWRGENFICAPIAPVPKARRILSVRVLRLKLLSKKKAKNCR